MKTFLLLSLLGIYSIAAQAQCDNSWLNIQQGQSCVDIGNLVVSGNQLTVECTFSRDSTNTPVGTISVDLVSKHSHGNNSGNVNYLLRIDHAEMNAGGVFYATPSVPCLDTTNINTTYHCAMVYDGATLTFYRNGVIMSQVPASGNMATDNTVPTRIGSEFYVDNFSFDPTLIGYLNNVRIWNKALSQTDIKTNMKNDDNGVLIDPIPSNLLGYYNFGSTQSANGSSGLMNRAGSDFNGFIGTVVNGVTTVVSPAPAVIGAANPYCSVVDNCGIVTSKPCDSSWLNIQQGQSCVDVGNLVVSGNQLTVECTFSRDSTNTPVGTISVDLVSKHSHGNNSGNVNYLLRIDHAEMNAGGIFYATPSVPCLLNTNVNTTYHAAMVYDGATLTFYRNGVIMSQVPASGNMATDNTVPTRIGSEYYVDNFSFDPTLIGYLNNVRIWNKALLQSDIEANMKNDDNGVLIDPIPSNLLGYYNFGSTQSANGSSGLMNRAGIDFNGLIGTVVNGITTVVTPAPAVIGVANPYCGVVDTCGGVVPVVLTSFIANTINNEAIRLQWHTEQEIEINNYTIQRAAEGSNNFISIGSVNSNSNLPGNSYTFIDKDVLPNVIYNYRLIINEKSGNQRYSNICSAKINNNNFSISVLNPVENGQVKLLINGYTGNADIKLANSVGQIVLEQKVNSINASKFTLNIYSQPKGSYWIIVQTDKDKLVKNIVKL